MQFVANHGKSYDTTQEFGVRFARWLKADEYILANNTDPKSTHVAGHNHLSDSTEAEFKKLLGARQHSEADHPVVENQVSDHQVTDVKFSGINWTGPC